MQNEQDLLQILYVKWVDKTASREEVEQLFDLLAQVDVEQSLGALMKDRWDQLQPLSGTGETSGHAGVRKILERYPSVNDRIRPLQKIQKITATWYRYAAVAILVGGMAAYFLRPAGNVPASSKKLVQPVPAKVLPGGSRALLTLGDGSTILLDNATNGQLLRQGGANIVKSGTGEIFYRTDKSGLFQQPVDNTMSTPRGGNYKLKLSDGTLVWLNAASSITFPTAFTGNERHVKITGEVYLEVAKNAQKPFFAHVNEQMQVEVLGTHFNINAYHDEYTINTTLLEGSIRLKSDRSTNMMNPGQQAQVHEDGRTVIKNDVDLLEVIAWKNDEFQFGDKSDFKAIMRQISRWYDIDVEYKGNVSGHLGGSISRQADISFVLQMLEKASGMHFEIQGKRVIVTP